MLPDGLPAVYLQLMEDILYNKFEIIRFINHPVPSNSYVVYDKNSRKCIIIDPGSKNPREISTYISENSLFLQYILLTHEHFDHMWGVKPLLNEFHPQLVCSKRCAQKISVPQNYYNLLYYNSEEYHHIDSVDIITEEVNNHLHSYPFDIYFINTPGHSSSSICIHIGNYLFTGDTIMNGFKPFIKKRHEGSIEEFQGSIELIFNSFPPHVLVYPGHGESFTLGMVEEFYRNYK